MTVNREEGQPRLYEHANAHEMQRNALLDGNDRNEKPPRSSVALNFFVSFRL